MVRTGLLVALNTRGIAAEITAFVQRTCVLVPRDPLLDAREEIERYDDRELYVGQFAELAGQHPVTFSRAFARWTGTSPRHFRRMKTGH